MPAPTQTEDGVLASLHQLLVAAHLWSSGQPVELEAIATLRSGVLVDNHRRYLAEVPAYRGLAEDRGVGADADLGAIRAELIMTEELFKGYDPAWPAADTAALTRWLATISTVDTDGAAITSTGLDAWRTEMKSHGVAITFSSGTGGQPSLVPRDHLTLAALRSSSGVRLPWALEPGSYDCVLFTLPGMGLGIQSGAAGLAAGAANVHRVAPPPGHSGDGDPTREAMGRATEFLRRAADGHRPVLLYGPPSGVAHLATYLSETATSLALPASSCVVTGGGWKGGTPRDPAVLFATLAEHLGVERARCVDTFSSAELNTVFVTCARGRYHVPPVVEALVLDDLLRPVEGDEAEGRLAVLDPFARSYPGFLTTGDAVRLRHDDCACGLAGTTLSPPIVRASGAPARGCGSVEAVTW